MNREALDRYVDRSVDLVSVSPQMDEQNTRAKLVDPLVREVLGWDLYSTEVKLEYPIQMGSSRTKVDYALLLEGSPAAFIEAKGCDTTLTDRHENQLRSYMQQQWVDWGLLTNGVVLKLFRLRKSEDQPSVELLGESKISELHRQSWLVRTLSKESIRSGDAEGIYRSVERRRRAISQLTQHKDEISDELLEVLSERVGDSIAREVESETKAFVDDLVESLSTGEPFDIDRTPEPASTVSKDESESGTTIPGEPEPNDRPAKGEYVVAFDEEETSYRAATQSDAMAKAVDHLISKHDLI